VPLDRAFAPHRRKSLRRWYRPASEPLPAEPGRLVVCALLGRARRARGCGTPGDDRLETRAYAVKRYLFRLGHAQRSARFATSIAQLVAGLAPVMGWGPVPRDRVERARFVRAHRRSVQRWLDDLQAAGIVVHEPERDTGGLWWRTQIVLRAAPEPARDELAVARRRARRWRSRERGRRHRPRVAPRLGVIRARSGVPSLARRARVAIERRVGVHEARRRAAVEARIVAAERARGGCRDLTHPFGAPPTSAPSPISASGARRPDASRTEGPAAQWPAQTVPQGETVVVKTGARERAALSSHAPPGVAELTAGSEESGPLSREAFDALVERRVAARERAAAQRRAVLAPQVQRRVAGVLAWPAGSPCPLGRLREAWVARRYGLATVVESGTAAAGTVPPGLAARVGRAIGVYEAFADHRPPDWPAGGAAALCVLAEQQRADRFAGDAARLLGLARGMRAAALEHDPARLQRARARAEARRAPATGRLAFRPSGRAPRIETPEARRCRVRDAVLLLGHDPAAWPNAALALAHLPIAPGADAVGLTDPDPCQELDGIGARAVRYRAQLARGRWPLPHDAPHDPDPHDPEEGSPR
jgi:hypothetical protein